MSNEIILNLDLPEYQDEFYSSENNADKNELWQQDANKVLISSLEKMGKDAQQYKIKLSKFTPQNANLNSYHHAIFISGARGTGKTVFLRNAKAIWESHATTKSDSPSLHFIDIIDPTLLNINDRFSEVIIASVYAAVDKNLKRPDIKQEKKDNFYSALKILSSALSHSTEFDEFHGIDRIQKYRSGIHIERYFHQFLITSVDLLGCDALVLLIDDVDMKIENAFGVIDDIRCLLSCPLILPLVSGDDDMYSHIATMKFEDSLAKRDKASNFNDGQIMAERLSNAYLTKVFPNHHRIPLVPIQQLLSKLIIKYNNFKINSISYTEYSKSFTKNFYPLCNGLERSLNWPQPENSREITQLIRLIQPHELIEEKSDISKDGISIIHNEDLWRKFSIWSEKKQDGIALTNSESFLKIKSMQHHEDLDLNNIIAFSPLMQKGTYTWAKKDFYSQQIDYINKLEANKTNLDILKTKFSSNDSQKNKTLRSLPPLEFIMKSMYINKKIAESDSKNKIFLSIYTHNKYYSDNNTTHNHIFFSRAFELLFWSLMAITGNLPQKTLDKKAFQKKLLKIMNNPPFYSSFAVNSTRYFNEEISEFDNPQDISSTLDDENENTNKEKIKSPENMVPLIKAGLEIHNWVIKNKNKNLEGINLIPVMSLVFNKTFSQLYVLRKNIINKNQNKNYNFHNEHLTDLAKRFEFIFINSFISFVSDNLVTNMNVATNVKSEIVRNYQKFSSYETILKENISNMEHLKNENTIILKSLVNAIKTHPIFELKADTPAYPIISSTPSQKILSEYVNIKNFNSSEIVKYYKYQSSNKKVLTREVSAWASNNIDIAERIYERINAISSVSLKKSSYLSRIFNGIKQVLEKNV